MLLSTSSTCLSQRIQVVENDTMITVHKSQLSKALDAYYQMLYLDSMLQTCESTNKINEDMLFEAQDKNGIQNRIILELEDQLVYGSEMYDVCNADRLLVKGENQKLKKKLNRKNALLKIVGGIAIVETVILGVILTR